MPSTYSNSSTTSLYSEGSTYVSDYAPFKPVSNPRLAKGPAYDKKKLREQEKKKKYPKNKAKKDKK